MCTKHSDYREAEMMNWTVLWRQVGEEVMKEKIFRIVIGQNNQEGRFYLRMSNLKNTIKTMSKKLDEI